MKMGSSSSSSSSSSCDSEESANTAVATQPECAINEDEDDDGGEKDVGFSMDGMDVNVDPGMDLRKDNDEARFPEEIKLPNISFGYYYGRSLQTMHTSAMLMLSGCPGEGVVERVNGRTIERTFDMSNCLLFDPDKYSKLVGRSKNSGFMDALRKASSEKAASLSLDEDYPSVVALSLVEGKQGVDPITVCTDFEVYCNDNPANPFIFSHVELVSGAMRHSTTLNQSSKLKSSVPDSSSIFGANSDGEESIVSQTSIETALPQQELFPIETALQGVFTLSNEIGNELKEKQDREVAAVSEELEDEIEIQFTYVGTSLSLFRESWDYPSSISMVFDD